MQLSLSNIIEFEELMVKLFGFGHGDAPGPGRPDRIAVNAFEFHRTAAVMIQLHAGGIGFHLLGVFDHFPNERLLNRPRAGRGRISDFMNTC